jgi:hypothetical protein
LLIARFFLYEVIKMAQLVETNKVYKCSSPNISAASIHVVSGNVNIVGSNVTIWDDTTKELISPAFSDLVSTGDPALGPGIYLFADLPEWIGFTGSGEIWIKMGVDMRIKPV